MEILTPVNEPGRKPIITKYHKRRILHEIHRGVHDTAVQINKSLRHFDNIAVSNEAIHNEAIRKHLRRAGYKSRAKVKNPVLTQPKMRLAFTNKYKNYDSDD